MSVQQLQPGDVVYARVDLYNDEGSIPELPEGAMIATVGTRGVVVNVGHLEQQPSLTLYLVRFEQKDQDNLLGPPTGCWPEELASEDELAALNVTSHSAGETP
ncbi:nitrogen fixation protein NifZ [Thioflexithrix psekupsensis]|uniref:Nitrogen fixation protein NifZ n=1 Tax=Thioflexithrix psekupsensis TaxID=1570016 RepID=A0A251X8V2_9GAMM|nr:nitrogen fixation protein NifZ [Thioflexithrix psekupsensis]OUD14489.1 nitrogen fixation protein NifZ [Thioflexithrix psekupsensis]